MKQTLFVAALIAAILSDFPSNAQWTGSGVIYPITLTDNVGIGLNTGIVDKLTVKGDIGFSAASGYYSTLRGRSSTEGLVMYANTSSNDGASLILHSDGIGTGTAGRLSFVAGGSTSSATGFEFLQYNSGAFTSLMSLNKDGNIGIGQAPSSVAEERVSIKGNIHLSSPYHYDFDRGILARTSNGRLTMFAGTTADDGAYILLNGKNHTDGGGVTITADMSNSNDDDLALTFYTYTGSTDWHSRMLINKIGQVGFGVNPDGDINSVDKVAVKGNIHLASPYHYDFDRGIIGHSKTAKLTMQSGSNIDDGASIYLFAKESENGSGVPIGGPVQLTADMENGASSDWAYLFNIQVASGDIRNTMVMNKAGKLGIGENVIYNMPDGYKLFVEDGILTEKLRVAVEGTGHWSDFVFADNYSLMPLHDVENYIKANKHLPEIPSAKEVVKEGVDVATMDAKLLQKIEELTLYVINQNKQLIEQNSRIKELEGKLNR